MSENVDCRQIAVVRDDDRPWKTMDNGRQTTNYRRASQVERWVTSASRSTLSAPRGPCRPSSVVPRRALVAAWRG